MRPRSGSTFRKEHLQSNVIGFSNDATSTYLAATEQWAELTPLLSFAFSAAKACDEMVWVPPATSDFAMRKIWLGRIPSPGIPRLCLFVAPDSIILRLADARRNAKSR